MNPLVFGVHPKFFVNPINYLKIGMELEYKSDYPSEDHPSVNLQDKLSFHDLKYLYDLILFELLCLIFRMFLYDGPMFYFWNVFLI